MELDSLTSEDAGKFLELYVALYNAAVRSGEADAMLERFADDAILDFEGVPDWGPFEGKAAISQRFYENPPDDEVRVTRWKYDRGRIVAEFRWKDIPEARGGCFVITPRAGKIAHLTVALGGPAAHWR